VVRVTMAVMARLDLGRSSERVVGLCKLGAWAAAVTTRLSFGFERVVVRLRELEAWVATVEARIEAARVAVAKVVEVTMRLSLPVGGLGKVVAGLRNLR